MGDGGERLAAVASRASGGHPLDVRSALSRSAGARDAVWGVPLRLQEAGGCAVGGGASLQCGSGVTTGGQTLRSAEGVTAGGALEAPGGQRLHSAGGWGVTAGRSQTASGWSGSSGTFEPPQASLYWRLSSWGQGWVRVPSPS